MSSHPTGGPIDPSLLPHDVHQAFAAYVAQPPSPTSAGGGGGPSGSGPIGGGGSGRPQQRSHSPRPTHLGAGGGQGSTTAGGLRSSVGESNHGHGHAGLYDLGSVVNDDGSSVVDVVGLQSLSDAGFHLGNAGGPGPSSRTGPQGNSSGDFGQQQAHHLHYPRSAGAYHPSAGPSGYGGGGGGGSQAGGTDDGHSTKDGGTGAGEGSDRQTTDGGGGRGGKKRKRAPNGQGVRTIARRQAEEGASYITSAAGRATAFKNGIATIEHNMRLLETKTGAMIFYIAALPDEPPHASASPQQWISHTSPALLAPVPADFYVTPTGEPLFPGELDPIQPAEAAAQAHQTLAEAIAALQQRWRAHNPGEPERKKGRPNGGHLGSAAGGEGEVGTGGGMPGAVGSQDDEGQHQQQQQQHPGHPFQQQQHHLGHHAHHHHHHHHHLAQQQQHAALSAHALEQQQQQQAANDAGEQYLNHHDMTDGTTVVGVGGSTGGPHDPHSHLPGETAAAGGDASPSSAAAAVAAVVAQQELQQHLQQFSQDQQQQQQQQATESSHAYAHDPGHLHQPPLDANSNTESDMPPPASAAAAAAAAAADERALDEALLLGTGGEGAFDGSLDMAGSSTAAPANASGGRTHAPDDDDDGHSRTVSSGGEGSTDLPPELAAQFAELERARAELDASREAVRREKADWARLRAAATTTAAAAAGNRRSKSSTSATATAAGASTDDDDRPTAGRHSGRAPGDDNDNDMLVLGGGAGEDDDDDDDGGLPSAGAVDHHTAAAADDDDFVMKLA